MRVSFCALCSNETDEEELPRGGGFRSEDQIPRINRTDMIDNDTSGYSSTKTSPQTSHEDLIKLKPTVRRLLRKYRLDFDSGLSEDENEEDCDFRPVLVENETEPHKEWYNKLIKLRCEHPRGVKYVFPPFPPPPLPSTMLAASRAWRVNPFEEVKRAAVKNPTNSPSTSSPNSINRFCPTDFRSLPPPHVFLQMIKTLAPHQYVDLTYALAGAALLNIGAKVPERFPPIPPRIEPFQRVVEEDRVSVQEMSSQSSSGGEYSDDSEETKEFSKLKREKNCQRRAERKVQIAARRIFLEKFREETEKEKPETFARDQFYKSKTLSKFIPTPPKLPVCPPPPLIPPFFPFGPMGPMGPMRPPMRPFGPPFPPMDPDFRPPRPRMPIMMIPYPIPPPPPPPMPPMQQLRPPSPKNRLKLRMPVKERKDPKIILLCRNETAMNKSSSRWRPASIL